MARCASKVASREARRHQRLSIAKTARLHLEGLAPERCEIRDVCPSGMFVTLTERTSSGLIPTGARIEIQFNGTDQRHALVHRVNGEVVRVTAEGLGIFVAQFPSAALAALSTGHERKPSKRGADSPCVVTIADPAQILEAFRGCLRSFLETTLEDFFSLAADVLSERSQMASDFAEMSKFGDARHLLAQSQPDIQVALVGRIHEEFSRLSTSSDDEGRPTSMPLSIVGKDEFDDWLNLSAVIYGLDLQFRSLLTPIEQRLSRLAGQALSGKASPAGPELLCRALSNLLQELALPPDTRSLLYQLFGAALARHYPPFSEQAERVLAAVEPIVATESIDEHPRPQPGSKTRNPRRDAEQDRAANAAEPNLELLANTLIDLSRRLQHGIAAGAGDNALAGAELLVESTITDDTRRTDSSPDRASTRDIARFDPVLNHLDGAIDVTPRLESALRRLDGLRRTHGAASPTARVAPGSEPLIAELSSRLEALPPGAFSALGNPVAPTLTQWLDRYPRRGTAPETATIPSELRQMLDAAGSLIVGARNEQTPGSEIEPLLQRLERPLLKLAMREPELLSDDEHPARDVFNLLDQCRMAVDDDGRFLDEKLQKVLSLLVDRLCARADQEPTVFVTVRDSLRRVVDTIRRARRTRVAMLQEACEGRQRIRSARVLVDRLLDDRFAGREVPEIVLRLLNVGWHQHLVRAAIRDFGDRGECLAGLELIERVSSLLLGDLDPAAEPEPASAILEQVASTLAAVNVDAREVGSTIVELSSALPGHAAARDVRVGRVPIPHGHFVRTHGAVEPEPGAAAGLRIGDWWSLNRDGRWLPLQMIWRDDRTGNSAFTNRSGTVRIEYEAAALRRMIDEGDLRPEKDQEVPLLERSEYGLLDQTYRHLVHQSLRDPVTGLPNRKGFGQQLAQLESPRAGVDAVNTVCIVEFDQFRAIYSQCGVEAGDLLAQRLAAEIRSQIGSRDSLASFGEGTFAILLRATAMPAATERAERLLRHFRDYRFRLDDRSQYSLGINIGVAEHAPGETGESDVIRRADSACLTARAAGRNRLRVYTGANAEVRQEESLLDLAGRLDRMLDGDSLYLRAQRVVPVGDSQLLPYYEILLGIHESEESAVGLADFIAAAERLKRAHEVDLWVIAKVFDWTRRHPSAFARLGGFAINLSALSLSSPEVLNFLHSQLGRGDLEATRLTFEITETAAMRSYAAAAGFIQQIRRYGCKFSLDDFGSGYASYAHLKNLHVHSLKIDGSFVRDMIESPADHAMVKSMSEVGHFLGMRTVAEFCHSDAVFERLREIGVDYVQGFAIHEPVALDALLGGD